MGKSVGRCQDYLTTSVPYENEGVIRFTRTRCHRGLNPTAKGLRATGSCQASTEQLTTSDVMSEALQDEGKFILGLE